MRTQKRRPLTPAQREARRRNGQQSTGPRTPMGKKIVSMNAVKHGMYSTPSIESMAVLQENPLEYVKLLAGLIGSFILATRQRQSSSRTSLTSNGSGGGTRSPAGRESP